jgi:DNA-binding LacI/PurR family transcriptional regulator
MGAVTLQQVAKEVSVSTTSVSDILQRGQRARYRQETVDRVCAAAERMGYQAHAAARLLRQGTNTTLVGVAVRTEVLGRESVNPTVVAIEKAIAARGFQPILIDPAHMVPVNSHAPFPSPDMIAGIISADLAMESEVPEFYRVLTSKLPIVALYPLQAANVNCVTTDRARAMEMAVEHLAALGHERIAFAEIMEPHGVTSAPKVKGWRRGLKKCNLRALPGYEISLTPGRYVAELGYEIAQTLPTLNPRPTALVCGSDEIALSAIRHLSKQGLSLPQDLSIIGFNGSAHGEFSYPSLTTVAQPVEQIASLATQRLLHLVELNRSGKEVRPRQQLVEPLLIERESTARLK